MTILDRPLPVRRPTASPSVPEQGAPAPFGGSYVTTSSARPVTEGTYVTRTDAFSQHGPVAPATRGTYVSTSSSAPSGGTYTYTG